MEGVLACEAYARGDDIQRGYFGESTAIPSLLDNVYASVQCNPGLLKVEPICTVLLRQ